jgi:hypothetical protein
LPFAPAIAWTANAIEWAFQRIARIGAFYTEFLAQLLAGSKFSTAKNEAAKARDELIKEQEQDALRLKATNAARRAAKDEANAASPEFKADADARMAKEKEVRARGGAYSDSRLAVGGFLGGGQTTKLANLAERQLATQNPMALTLHSILSAIKNPSNPLSLIIPH